MCDLNMVFCKCTSGTVSFVIGLVNCMGPQRTEDDIKSKLTNISYEMDLDVSCAL